MKKVEKRTGERAVSVNSADITRLVKEAQRGSDRAFRELYRIYYPQIYYFALKHLHSEDLAEEATQACFFGVCTNFSQLRAPESFQYWIFCIARRAVQTIQSERRRIDSHECSLDEGESDWVEGLPLQVTDPSGQSPESLLETREVQSALYAGIEHLPAVQRETIILYYLAGFSIAETAELLDITTGAVRKRLYDGRTLLKKRFIQPLSEIADETPLEFAERQMQRRILAEFFGQDPEGQGAHRADSEEVLSLPALTAQAVVRQTAKSAHTPGYGEHLRCAVAKKAASAKRIVPKVGAPQPSLAKEALIIGVATVMVTAMAVSCHALMRREAPVSATQPAQLYLRPRPKTAAKVASLAATTTASFAESAARPQTDNNQTSAIRAPASQPAPQAQAAAVPTIVLACETLSYPVGSAVSADQMLADCGAVAYDARGVVLPMSLIEWQTVDFNRPGTAHVYLEAHDSAGASASQTLSITIIP
ncbi:MAG: sigma-70 family RNA polymerase sigma factor [Actinomycetia bacterium]|nr:sigma-70 family RNA polymerase sigma factor [Actinomycetes bacterium]